MNPGTQLVGADGTLYTVSLDAPQTGAKLVNVGDVLTSTGVVEGKDQAHFVVSEEGEGFTLTRDGEAGGQAVYFKPEVTPGVEQPAPGTVELARDTLREAGEPVPGETTASVANPSDVAAGGEVVAAEDADDAEQDAIDEAEHAARQPDQEDDEEEEEELPPTQAATKPEWVAWAIDHGMSEEEAEAATKEALVERFGIHRG